MAAMLAVTEGREVRTWALPGVTYSCDKSYAACACKAAVKGGVSRSFSPGCE